MMSGSQERLRVSSPLKGWCATLDDSPDPVFRDRILGEGMSIDPTMGEVRAPFDAEVLTVPDSRHAINLRAANGAEFLIHVGIDSVKMAGDGFETHVAPGDRVALGQLLLSFDLDKVLRGAASLRTPVLLLQSDKHEILKFCQEGPVDFGDALFEVCSISMTGETPAPTSDGDEVSESVAVGLEHGIHARPAAALIAAIRNLEARVYCRYGGQQAADARSAVALMSLGVHRGDIVTVTASGKDAHEAVRAFTALLEPLAVDTTPPDLAEAEPARPVQSRPVIKKPAEGSVFCAQPASPGLGRGQAFKLESWNEFDTTAPGPVSEERQALHGAVEKVRTHLQRLADYEGGTGSEIAIAHLALLDDPLITADAEHLLTRNHSAASAWRQAVNNAVETLGKLVDQRMLERVDDLLDINLRVQRVLAGEDPEKGPELPPGSIVLADNMLPSQLLELDHERVNGICLAMGGATSHVAILAISLNIPMLVAAGQGVMSIEEGSPLLLDAEFGELQYRPAETMVASFDSRIGKDKLRQQEEQAAAGDECRTLDGTRIHINANIASAPDALASVDAGAEGCGLLRTEFIFMERTRAPDVDEQLRIYQQISDALGPRPLVVRTLDAGGDKPISYIDQEPEDNPALGVRGIRLSLNNKDMLRTQLDALLRLERSVPLQLMIPMVSTVDEVQAVREIIEEMGQPGNAANGVKLGVMIETPAAALIAGQLASIVDFFSIGTNDLTQYTLCMDRGEPQLAAQLDTLHPAVLSLIKLTVDAAMVADIPVAVCGGAAGDMLAAPLLLGLGVRELSMPRSLIARQKANLRKILIEDCTNIATTALAMNSATDVRAMMREFVTTQ